MSNVEWRYGIDRGFEINKDGKWVPGEIVEKEVPKKVFRNVIVDSGRSVEFSAAGYGLGLNIGFHVIGEESSSPVYATRLELEELVEFIQDFLAS